MNDRSAASAGEPRVVVGVDGSEPSLRALDVAAEEAGRRGAELELIYAAAWPRRSAVPVTPSDEERIQLDAAVVVDSAGERARERVPGLPVVGSVLTESLAADALVRATRTAAVTVVGTRGHGGFTGLLVGSVSLRVASHCQGPLLVVGGSGRDGGRGTVLAGLHTEADEPAVRFGFEEAARRGSALRVLHAWYQPRIPGRFHLPPREAAAARTSASELVRKTVAPISTDHPGVRVSAEELSGSPAGTLIEASRAADVVVLAVHRRQEPRLGLHLGSVAHALLHHAYCPVLLVPTPATKAGPS